MSELVDIVLDFFDGQSREELENESKNPTNKATPARNYEDLILEKLDLSPHQQDIFFAYATAHFYKTFPYEMGRIFRSPIVSKFWLSRLPIFKWGVKEITTMLDLYDDLGKKWVEQADLKASKFNNAARVVAGAVYIYNNDLLKEEKENLNQSEDFSKFEEKFRRSIGTPNLIRNAANRINLLLMKKGTTGTELILLLGNTKIKECI